MGYKVVLMDDPWQAPPVIEDEIWHIVRQPTKRRKMKFGTANEILAVGSAAISMGLVFAAFYLVTLETWYGYAGMACCAFWAYGFMRGAKAFANKVVAAEGKGE